MDGKRFVKNLKQPKQLANPKMKDRKERYKSLSKFKDVAKKCFGAITSIGWGKGKKILCSVCKKEVTKGTYKEGKWYCKEC